ncbi:ABC-type dipeptide transport system, extracellular component [Modestobacter italicus]|uniref:ABC-type dipeptide transport system, extracellular component n=1 Tax=Modestobacter italicus (strain DSM 44449 / CECT 9708 / BC 501) TaxID=2732864 RepID=I4F1B6_MODI5|nr:ABC transporter substrate-binding protein [Modestobacter marinus]CCH89429.1 ABC-type dipeptide transport system, extracellular component [Modestobacter marinus]
MTRATRIRSVGVAAVAALALTACGGGSSSDSGAAGGGAPTEGGDLTIARQADILSMDKTTTFDNSSIYVMEQIMEPLFMVSQDGTEVEPWLASDYTMSDDELTYTIKLREGVTFSNGDPMTAADVKFSIDEDTKTGADGWGFINAAIDTVEATDDSTVTIKLKYAWAPLLADLSLFSNAIIPENYGGKTAEEFYTAPVGTGPFVWNEWKQGQYVKVDKNPDYWGDGPYLDSVTWTVVPDANTRKLQLQGGQIDIDEFPDWSGFGSLKDAPGITATAFPSTRIDYVAFNQLRGPFEDVHVRRAIAYALDREAMVKTVLFGNGEAADSLLSPGTPYYAKNPDAPSFDLDKAKEELAQSSQPNGFSTSILINAGDPNQVSVAQIMQSQLKELGIDLKINSLDATAVRAARNAQDFDMIILGWTMDIPDPDEWTSFAVDPEGGSNSAYTNYNNPEVIALNKQAQAETDEAKRADLYEQLQAKVADDAFAAYLYYSPYAYAMSDKVSGFEVTPLGNYHLEDVSKSE